MFFSASPSLGRSAWWPSKRKAEDGGYLFDDGAEVWMANHSMKLTSYITKDYFLFGSLFDYGYKFRNWFFLHTASFVSWH
jgi:hypothetical protein